MLETICTWIVALCGAVILLFISGIILLELLNCAWLYLKLGRHVILYSWWRKDNRTVLLVPGQVKYDVERAVNHLLGKHDPQDLYYTPQQVANSLISHFNLDGFDDEGIDLLNLGGDE